MLRSSNNPWLHRFAVLTVLATLALLGIGGLVTSHGAGMAVPDWPNTYGYNMFLFPPSKWVGGIFYEHSHRLVASGVGLLTTILTVWLWCAESRRWLRWLGVVAFFAVVLQGVLGGLRVVLFKDQLGIFHATLAQLFFALVCAIALFTSRWWRERRSPDRPVSESPHRRADPEIGATVRWLFLMTTILIFLQLVLGATMRHQHAGLAISDFPLAHGKLWPAMDADSVARYNQQRVEVTAANPITAFQIGLQMAHRAMALVILVCVGVVTWRVPPHPSPLPQERGKHPPLPCENCTPDFSSTASAANHPTTAMATGAIELSEDVATLSLSPGERAGVRASFKSDRHLLRRVAIFWLALIFIQAGLGAWTIWSNKAADVATMHVLVGALSLVTGTLGCIIAFRRLAGITGTKPAAASINVTPGQSFRGHSATTANQ